MNILISEDDLTSRMILSSLLRKKGHEIIETGDGSQAWEVMQKDDAPHMAIIDWMMPGIDGLQLVRKIRAQEYDTPPYLIMLTSKSGKADIVQALNAGADDYLSKPFDGEELWARVDVGIRIIEMQEKLRAHICELEQALEHIKILQGILPICSFCKKIRDDSGYWNAVDLYMTDHSEVRFSHSICPDCFSKEYPDFCKAGKTQGQ